MKEKTTIKDLLAQVNAAVDAQDKQKKIAILKNELAKKSDAVAGLEYKAGGKQEDASEFLIPLFDELYDEPPLTEISRITLLKKSDKYKTKPEKSDSKKTIELEIGNGKSMSVLLGNFQKEEAMNQSEWPKYVKGSGIEGSDESGSDPLKSSKKLSLSIKKGATEIVVSAKRFKQDNLRNITKIHNAIKLDDIKLPITGDKNGKKVKFEPTAFVVHSGEFGGGHYLAYVKEKDKKGNVSWYEYDDSRVRKISESEKCIPQKSVGANVSKAMGLDPEKSVSFLELRKKQAYIVKYSTQNERGEIPLPQRSDNERVGAVNLDNTCWANAAAAFAGSFTSFEKEKVAQNSQSFLIQDIASDTKIEQVRLSIHQEKPQDKVFSNKPVRALNRLKEYSEDLNTCWANAAAAFAGSFTSFEQKKVAENPRPHLNHRVDPKKDVPEKHVHFASRDNVMESNKSDPIPNQKPIQHQAKISDKSSTIESKTLGDLKREFEVDNLNLPGVKESETFSHIDEIAKKLKIYGEEVDSKTKKLIKREIDQQDKVFSNKLVRALNRLREPPEDLNDEEKTWKNLTTLDRRVLVDYYNQNHGVKIDFQSLYKEAEVGQKEELTVNSQGYVLDSKKIEDLKDIMSYAAKAIPKTSIKNPVVKKLAEKSHTRY
jgi:hypothetical protein